MSQSVGPLFIRRYQILTVICGLILALLLVCLDASYWRTIETSETKLLLPFYLPLRHDSLRTQFKKNESRTFQLNIGPLWRCLTTRIPAKDILIHRECTVNDEDHSIILLFPSALEHFLSSQLFLFRWLADGVTIQIKLVRLLMSFTLELASLWLIYGFFSYSKKSPVPCMVGHPLDSSLDYSVFLIVCVLEWDDYFREIYRTSCSSTEADRNERVNVWGKRYN